jgi:hypothetical protein
VAASEQSLSWPGEEVFADFVPTLGLVGIYCSRGGSKKEKSSAGGYGGARAGYLGDSIIIPI